MSPSVSFLTICKAPHDSVPVPGASHGLAVSLDLPSHSAEGQHQLHSVSDSWNKTSTGKFVVEKLEISRVSRGNIYLQRCRVLCRVSGCSIWAHPVGPNLRVADGFARSARPLAPMATGSRTRIASAPSPLSLPCVDMNAMLCKELD